MTLCVQCERDEDGRWLAKMPGAIAYGETIEEAMAKVEALALQASDAELEPSLRDASPKRSNADRDVNRRTILTLDRRPILTPLVSFEGLSR